MRERTDSFFAWYVDCVEKIKFMQYLSGVLSMANAQDLHTQSQQKNRDHKFEEQMTHDLLVALHSPRVVIETISPCVDGGKYPAKAIVDQYVNVSATIFMDGHDKIAARLLWQKKDTKESHTVLMHPLGNDRWSAGFLPISTGLHIFAIEAWFDRWSTYRDELRKKTDAGVATAVDIQEGKILAAEICQFGIQKKARHSRALHQLQRQLEFANDAESTQLLLSNTVDTFMRLYDVHRFLHRSPALTIDVERTAAGFSSWYELFPRSQLSHAENNSISNHDGKLPHGTFDDVIARLPAIHAMGFDVLYFPPIHPIGKTHRKGRNNSLIAGPDDPGSPYAIGAAEGGHDAVHPDLGGIEAFRRLRAAALDYGIEIALDFAVQCSPDHPWLEQHPDWFAWRPDGSIRYAENPPKKYEDIVNVNFYAEGAQPALWQALRDVVLGWVEEGVKIFRVDNPHTKPLPFWQWLIADVRAQHPDVIFLSEAFTRPAMMYELAKIGFTQSYTYFTWRNSKQELTDYLLELTTAEPRDFFRPHFFVNTPDINPYYLQSSGRGGFKIRAALAATLSGLWGMYSGFELCEAESVPGKEEYWYSEKYEIKPRDWNAPGNIIALITRLNRIRRENAALQTHLGLRFLDSGNDQVLYFAKTTFDHSNIILVAISLDPHHPQEAYLEIPFDLLATAIERGVSHHEMRSEKLSLDALPVEELLRDQHLTWHGARQHWYFDPNELPLGIWRVSVPERDRSQQRDESAHDRHAEFDLENAAHGGRA